MPSKQTEMGEIDGEIPTPNVIINATSRDANVQKKAFSGALALAAIAAYMGSIGMGSVVGFSSPTVPLLKTYDKPLRITDDEADWFASLVNVGALIAGPIAGMKILTDLLRFSQNQSLLLLANRAVCTFRQILRTTI